MTQMPAITVNKLPCELIASILRNLDNLRSLPPALLACRHFYASFKQYHGIEAAIFLRQVTPALVPYSVVFLEASRLPQSEESKNAVRGLLDTLHSQPSRLAAQLSTMSPSLIRRMAHTHDVIHHFATDFAASAWTELSRKPGSDCSSPRNTTISVSPSEYFRFCRAFYQLDLFHWLYRSDVADPSAERANLWFFSKYSPWEMEQLGSVYDFLDEKLAKASYDVVAHDIEFGEVGIDYLNPATRNYSRQCWLSQGVEYIYKLMSTTSYETTRAVLADAFCGDAADLLDVLEDKMEAYSEDTLKAVEECSKDQLQTFLSSCGNDDTEKGPFEAWHAAHTDLPDGNWVMLEENAWLRRCAYVFWDWDRIQSHDLLPIFGSLSNPSVSLYTPEEYEIMEESFHERSKIWLEGGLGYWSKGDTSRIKFNGVNRSG
ncbi:hypothetical protein F4777DRAFT_528505 [Nemania sp. FL0916]|nr:hypothetical protein F4777DRAFT_528505 [Nemania sp. FL0916]